jgi:uncharacterized membrane protein
VIGFNEGLAGLFVGVYIEREGSKLKMHTIALVWPFSNMENDDKQMKFGAFYFWTNPNGTGDFSTLDPTW